MDRAHQLHRITAYRYNYLSQDEKDRKLLHASLHGHTEIALALLAAGANKDTKNNYGSTALTLACCYGHTETAQALLTAGADKEANNIIGDTALIRASTNGHTETAQALLAAGADINPTNNCGRDALICARIKGHTDIVAMLARTVMAALRIHRFWRDVCYNLIYVNARNHVLKEAGFK